MLPLGLALTPALTAALVLGPFEPSPTPTTSEPTPPTTPAATVGVTPASVPAGGAPVTVSAVCAGGTAKAVVKSDAFAQSGAFAGAAKLTLKTSAEAKAGKYAVNLLCDGTAVSASTSLLITQATPGPTPTSPAPTSPAPNPTPSGPPQTGGGSTSTSVPYLFGGVVLIGAGSVAGTLALRRRRQNGA
ncbi:hypothetical protein [Actinomadura sp. WMMA1423]|uniref:hypothetical protein n=1 Tax=Actinomadura sp. WMMA1423 TaxID=2591108 RepID=UPI001146E624|nr:hypothetical protein [Actinomadura sp. WMMA1423]